MLTRAHDPYSGHEPSRRDLEAEAQAALAELTGATPEGVPCFTCGKPERPTHDPDSPGETVKHPFITESPGPQRKPQARKTTTRKRPARVRKTPPPVTP